MFPFQKKLAKIPILRFLSSVKIAVICLVFLFILTLWGTLFQVEHGLYLAQEKFFYSLIFFFWGVIPFPGARLVLWVLFVNLLCMCLTRLVFKWSKAGIILIHVGLLTFLVSSFITFEVINESNVTLHEKAATNVSSSYYDWEISVWQENNGKRQVYAYDAYSSIKDKTLNFSALNFSLVIKTYLPNCDAYTSADNSQTAVNASGIKTLKPRTLDKEPEKNTPGLVAEAVFGDKKKHILLYGAEENPTVIKIGDKDISFQLRRKRYELPFIIKLKDFMMEMHPNTQTARSYQSLVEITAGDVSREILISMNKPLRYKDFTLYQASYIIDEMGRELSTLAVVENSGRVLPYVASTITFLGLLWHFLLMAINRKNKK